jgi:transcriptional regulator with XRE-family HTH domain
MQEGAEGRSGRPKPDAVDAHVGARLRMRRTQLGLSQERLAESVGLTFQQIQKYERGVNRVGASRLWDLARALRVPIEFFYQDEPNETLPMTAPMTVRGFAEDGQEPFGGMRTLREDERELLSAYAAIADATVRQRVLDLVKSLAAPKP